MKKIITSFIAASIILPLGAKDKTPGEVAATILQDAPAMKALNLAHKAGVEALKIESNLPDPEIGGEYLFAGKEEKDRWGAEISWGLEWPGVYSARKSASESRILASEKSTDRELNNLLVEIKRLLSSYILQEKQISLLKSVASANDSLLSGLQKSFSAGYGVSILDMNKIKVEKAQADTQLQEVLSLRAETMSAIAAIYGADPSTLVSEMKCEFVWDKMPDDLSSAIEASPTVMAAEAEAEAARRDMKTAAREGLPNLSIGYRHAFEDGKHFNGPTIGISLPIFSARGKKRAAKLNAEAAEAKALATRTELRETILGGAKRYNLLQTYVDQVSKVIRNPENLRLLAVAYNGQQISLSEYLRERSYYFNAELDLLELEYNLTGILLDIEESL